MSMFYIQSDSDFALKLFAWSLLPSIILYLVRAITTGKAGTKVGVDADAHENPIAFDLHLCMFVVYLAIDVGYLLYSYMLK